MESRFEQEPSYLLFLAIISSNPRFLWTNTVNNNLCGRACT